MAQAHRNADIGYPRFKGDPHPMPATGVAFAPGGYLEKVFASDLAQGAGSAPGKDFWIDRMLARAGTGGGFGDSNNWLFTRGRAAYMYTHKPEEPGFVGDAAYGFKTGHDALFRLQAEIDGKPLPWKEAAAARRQTPSYFSTVFEDAAAGVRLRLVKFITQENVAVAQATLSSLDGKAHALSLKALSPMATHAEGDELTGAFQAHNDITTVFPRLSGDGFKVDGASLLRRVQVPATGETQAIKVQLGLTTRELPSSLAEYRRIRGESPAQAYRRHVAAYNRWWADNIPYLNTPEENIDKTLFYRWWLLRFNFLDAGVPGNDYQFPVAIEGVLGYDNAIVLTTGMFIDDLKYLRDPVYAYGSWIGAGEVAGGGKYVDNPGSPEHWSSSYAQYLTAAAWRSYQVHGGPAPIAGKLARYGRDDVLGLLQAYDRNGNGLIEYDWAAMTGNDADAVSFDWARQHGQPRMDRTESAYVYANALAAAEAAQLSGDAATARQMRDTAARIRRSVLDTLWVDASEQPDGAGLKGKLLKQRQAAAPGLPVDWKETNNYYPFSVGLMPKAGDPDRDPKYIEALRLFADADQYPVFPFYTANQADQRARGEGGSNNFSVINATVMFRLLASALRDYPSPYLDAQWYRKLLYWNAWAHDIDGDNRYPDQNEFWAKGDAADGGSIGYRSWIHHTQLGATNFTVIEDAIGLRPRGDGLIELYPIDIGWIHFAADNLRYHGHDLSIFWDRDGGRYGAKVPQGYSVFIDGQLAFCVDRLAHVLYDPASGRVEAAADAVNPAAAHVVVAHRAAMPRSEQVAMAADARVAEVLAKAGVDLSLPPGASDLAFGASTSASFSAAGFAPDAAVDGSTANEPFWGTAGSPSASDWIALDLAAPKTFDEVQVYFYRSSAPAGEQHGFPSGTRAGYAPPWMYVLQYFDGRAWKNVAGQRRDTPVAQGNVNRVRFPAITAQRVRVVVTHAGKLRTGIKEIQLYARGAKAAGTPANQPPWVEAWQEDGGARAGAIRVSGRVGDDALPQGRLSLRWSVQQAPKDGDAVFEDAASPDTSVRFTRPGDYVLRLLADDGALQAHADVRVSAPAQLSGAGVEVQGDAVATAQYTAGHHRLQALNDGFVPAPDSEVPADRRWGSWGRAQPTTVWLQYEWRHPVRISSSTMYFWDDQPEGGVALPQAWRLQYRRNGQWTDIAPAAAYPVAGMGQASRARFAPVITTALRAVLTSAEKSGGHAALGVDEWQVSAEMPEWLESIDVRTGIGQPPALPATVTAWYADHRSIEAGVSWPQLDPSRLSGEGRVDLHGIADGGAPVAATIWVRATEPGQVNTVDALADVVTAAGEAPSLPAFATVQYNDGSRERRPVEWPPVAATDYAHAGRFAVTGEVSGRGSSGRLPVKVQVVVSGE
ncbi:MULTISPECIES: Ig-like domain-containing protein [unclassified Dyella]|uniref:Ig-like domain-containing protein n=1 Tax=unclassified Dyella TaxID=2634549 RepID=UPI002032FFC7|nr:MULTISPECIES: Ig-like domain-containing protein [unclassified Dyella]